MDPQFRTQRQWVAIVSISIFHSSIGCPTIIIDNFGYGMGCRRGCEYVSNQAFIPSLYLHIHYPLICIGAAPMPIQHIFIVLPEPIPFHPIDNCVDIIPNVRFRSNSIVKNCLAVSKPCTKYEVSTRSAPSSFALKGITFPVDPFNQCGKAP